MATSRFSYYDRLDAAAQRVYRKSDAITSVPLSAPEPIRPGIDALREALATGDRAVVAAGCVWLCRAILADLGVSPVAIEVLEERPRGGYGELHGLYTWEPDKPDELPRIQVWMRTAAHARVVAFKTFLRTLLHELGHHLDFHYFELPDSYHTQGFYQRETSLFRQLVPTALTPPTPSARPPAPASKAALPVKAPPKSTHREKEMALAKLHPRLPGID